jgi:hypothetical protein
VGRAVIRDDERLDWEIETIRESIRIDWTELAHKDLPADKRRNIREHLSMCIESLKELRNRRQQKEMSSKFGAVKADIKSQQ